jgi:hypothetical protein
MQVVTAVTPFGWEYYRQHPLARLLGIAGCQKDC